MILAESSVEVDYIKPIPELSEYVEYIWMIRNISDKEHKIIVLPNGRFASADAYDSLGEAYMAAGDKAGAKENYSKSLALNPNNENAREKLLELER